MTEREKNEVKRMWEQGDSTTAIARLLPYKEYISKAEIRKLKKEGFLKPRKVCEIRDKTIVAEVQPTTNLREVAARYGLTVDYIYKILWRNGVRHPKIRTYHTSEKAQDILDELAGNGSPTEIAKKYGVSRQFVYQLKNLKDERQ